jgi:hypothetical protein
MHAEVLVLRPIAGEPLPQPSLTPARGADALQQVCRRTQGAILLQLACTNMCAPAVMKHYRVERCFKYIVLNLY